MAGLRAGVEAVLPTGRAPCGRRAARDDIENGTRHVNTRESGVWSSPVTDSRPDGWAGDEPG